MRKIIILFILLFTIEHTYAQTDSFIKNYEQKIIENNKLKNDLQLEIQKNSKQSIDYKKDTIELQKKIKELQKIISSQSQELLALNESNIKQDRDFLMERFRVLQVRVDSLKAFVVQQNQEIINKDKQIQIEKVNANTIATIAKNDGKREGLLSILNSYKNISFDDLIKSSTKESVARDYKILNNDIEVKSILNDLQIYYDGLNLLKEKFNLSQIKSTQSLLKQIKRPSKLLDTLKDNIEYYQNFNNSLKETISKLIDLDKHKKGDDISESIKFKKDEMSGILINYMFNYYDYYKYPYLFEIVLEIIKRKIQKVDDPITDLLQKL